MSRVEDIDGELEALRHEAEMQQQRVGTRQVAATGAALKLADLTTQ